MHRVLLLSDELTTREVVRRGLEARGVCVVVAEGGTRADPASQAPADLLLLDLATHRGDGAALLRRVRDSSPAPAAPLIAIVPPDDRVEEARRALEAGADDCIEAPVCLPLLAARVRAHLRLVSLEEEVRRLREESGRKEPPQARPSEAPPIRGGEPVVAPGGREAGAPPDEDSGAVRPLRLLLAEDTESGRLLIEAMLRRTPHLVEAADNGQAAVDRFARGRYDAVLLDLEMPLMDGWEAARRMRRHEKDTGLPPTPIIALTAHTDPDVLAAARAAGCTGHLAKPVRKQALLHLLAGLAGGSPESGPVREEEPALAARVDPLLRELMPDFLRETAEQLQRMASLLAGGDFAALRSEAHRLKGVGGSYGFAQMSEAAAALEQASARTDSARAADLLAALQQQLDGVRAAYRA